MENDARLIARCLEGQEAFEELYRRHAGVVFTFLKGMHRGDEHAAADSLQETFLRAYKALDRFDTSRPLRPWLFVIASNVARDALDRAKRAKAQAISDMGIVPSDEPGPEREATARDLCFEILERAAARLPARALAAFLLTRTQGMSCAEVAQVHQCSIPTVKRDLSDALASLTGVIAEMGLAS